LIENQRQTAIGFHSNCLLDQTRQQHPIPTGYNTSTIVKRPGEKRLFLVGTGSKWKNAALIRDT
jgi:hypothetical protein